MASLYLALVGVALLGPTIASWTHRERFTAAGWQANDRTDVMWPTRLCMIDDLVGCGLPARAGARADARRLRVAGALVRRRASHEWEIVRD
jgi:hypothetical protein